MPWKTQASILRRHALHLFIYRFLPCCCDLPDVYIHTYIYIYMRTLFTSILDVLFFFSLFFSIRPTLEGLEKQSKLRRLNMEESKLYFCGLPRKYAWGIGVPCVTPRLITFSFFFFPPFFKALLIGLIAFFPCLDVM